jgi:hypothetical protein
MMPDPGDGFQSFMNGVNSRITAEDRQAGRSGRSWRTRRPAPDVTRTEAWQRHQEEQDERIASLSDELRAQRLYIDEVRSSSGD